MRTFESPLSVLKHKINRCELWSPHWAVCGTVCSRNGTVSVESDGTDRKVPLLSPALDVFLGKVTFRASCLAYMEVIDCIGGNWC